jgi:hypothetical protein
MKRVMRAVAGAAVAVPGLVGWWVTSDAGAAPPRCFGRRPTIVGTAADDRLVGTVEADVIVGLGGDDDIEGRGGNDRICGGRGNDLLSGTPGAERLSGGPGSDRLIGGSGPNVVRGGPGRDALWTGSSLGGTFDGGGGFDGISVLGRGCATGVTIDLARQFARWPACPNDGYAGRWKVVRVEDIQGSRGPDRLFGNAVGNEIWGFGGADVIRGRRGDDFLHGDFPGLSPGGNDTVFAGPGDDQMYGGGGTDGGSGGPGDDVCQDFERLTNC